MIRNPIFEAAMTRRMRSILAPTLITLYVLFLALVSIGALTTLQRAEVSLANLRAGIETYIYLSVMQFFLIVLVAPALTSGSIAGERERQTLDLLLCTRMGALRIVVGKLFSSACFLVLMILTSFPIMAVMLFFGGITLSGVLMMLLLLSVTALACCSIGIFCSAVFKRTVTATVVAYLIIFALGVGTIVFPYLFQFGQLSEVLNAYSTRLVGSSGGAVAIIGSASGPTSVYTAGAGILGAVPKLLFLNPAVGLFSLLVEQTGILRRTFEGGMGVNFYQLYELFQKAGSLATVNILVLLGCSAVLTGLAALFVKPMGRRARKRKKA